MINNNLVSIIENGLYEFLFEFAANEINSIHNSEKYKYVISQIPKFCNVFGTNISEMELDKEILKINSIYNDKKLSYSLITGPSTNPASTKDYLQNKGYRKINTGFGKIIDLENYCDNIICRDSLKINKIKDAKELSTWLVIVKDIFNFTENQSQILFDILTKKIFVENKFNIYTGFFNNTPVCSGALYKGKTSAVIYWISTIPEMRRMGLATEMMTYLLREIKKSGYRYSSLQSSSIAYKLYKKFNFIHCCDFDFYANT